MQSPGTDPLLLDLAAGDERAYALLYDRFAGRLYRVALAMLGRAEDAEDVVQELFLAVVRSRKRLPYVQDLTAYMFSSLRRAAGRRSARLAPPAVPLDAVGEPAAPADRPEADSPHTAALARAMQSLPPKQREVIALKFDAELTFAEIARVIGISSNTAASRCRYALEKLRLALLRAGGER
ncbi:MAG: sigma-70 family RNA polymerase sigma factor [Thermoguttaceae bacterium]|jgi:RNA polymerase sigma-70 factor (ECF subfamily)